MATTTTNAFNLDIGDIVDEAFDRCGLEARTGYDYKTARRSLDLMMLEWQNRGLNLWTLESGTTTLTAGTSEYTFDADTVDMLEVHLRLNSGETSNQTDYDLTRVSVSGYADLPNKLQEGRPLQYYVERLTSSFKLVLYPIPDDIQTYVLSYYRVRQVYDSGDLGSYNMDVPKLFLPSLVAGLAYYVGMKYPEAVGNRLALLKQEYMEQFDLAAEENRVKASFRFVPWTYNS